MTDNKQMHDNWMVGKSFNGFNTVICTNKDNPSGTAIAFTVIRKWNADTAADMAEAEDNATLLASAPRLVSENVELKSAVSRLVAALRNLHDEQNGPPKCWDTAGWDAAMEETEELLKEFEK